MVGLRTQEDARFIPFFTAIQKEASKSDSVFFLDNGEGHSVFDDDIICTDCSGWLIPSEKADEFNKLFVAFDEIDEKWDDFAAWVTWSGECSSPAIDIKLI